METMTNVWDSYLMTFGEKRGRSNPRNRRSLLLVEFGVKDEEDVLHVKQVRGPAPSFNNLLRQLIGNRLFNSWFVLKHFSERDLKYELDIKSGMSGCNDYNLIREEYPGSGYCRVKNIFHESCSGTWNDREIFIPLRDMKIFLGLMIKHEIINRTEYYLPKWKNLVEFKTKRQRSFKWNERFYIYKGIDTSKFSNWNDILNGICDDKKIEDK